MACVDETHCKDNERTAGKLAHTSSVMSLPASSLYFVMTNNHIHCNKLCDMNRLMPRIRVLYHSA